MFQLPEDRTFFIAEAGVNHNGRLELALELVARVAASGADAIKFQTFQSARTVVAAEAPLAEYMKTQTETAQSQESLLDQLCLPFDDFETISKACADAGIMFLSTGFDVPSVEFLVGLGVPLLKIPSGEITNGFLLDAYARARLPIILSTGMSELADVEAALGRLRRGWAEAPITLLHCTSSYPTPYDAVNLAAMDTLADVFGLPVGLSDHTMGTAIPIAAVGRGARVVEKHVTLDTAMTGPDHAASLAVDDLPGLIESIRAVEAAIGDGDKRVVAAEQDVQDVARRSVAAARDIAAGGALTAEDLTALRPNSGISPMLADRLIGQRARRAYHAGELLDRQELDG